MVQVWVTSATADSITLNDGRVIDLSTIPGNGWPKAKLNKARVLLQGLIDHRIPATDIPADEETLSFTKQQMEDVYKGRMWYEPNGDLMARHTIIEEVMFDGEKLNLSVRRA